MYSLDSNILFLEYYPSLESRIICIQKEHFLLGYMTSAVCKRAPVTAGGWPESLPLCGQCRGDITITINQIGNERSPPPIFWNTAVVGLSNLPPPFPSTLFTLTDRQVASLTSTCPSRVLVASTYNVILQPALRLACQKCHGGNKCCKNFVSCLFGAFLMPFSFLRDGLMGM